MKRLVISLVLSLVLVSIIATPAFAGPQSDGAVKVDIVPLLEPKNVVGFVIFNTNNNGGINVQISVDGLDEGTYRLFVQAPLTDPPYPPEYVDPTFYVDANGKATAHVQINDLDVEEGAEFIICRVGINRPGNQIAATDLDWAGTPVPLK